MINLDDYIGEPPKSADEFMHNRYSEFKEGKTYTYGDKTLVFVCSKTINTGANIKPKELIKIDTISHKLMFDDGEHIHVFCAYLNGKFSKPQVLSEEVSTEFRKSWLAKKQAFDAEVAKKEKKKKKIMSQKPKKIPAIHKKMAVYLSGYGGYPYAKKIDYTTGNYRIVRDFIYVRDSWDTLQEYAPSCNLLYYKGVLICKTIADTYDERVNIVFSDDANKADKQIEYFLDEYGEHRDNVVIPEAFLNAVIPELSEAELKARRSVQLATWRTTHGYYKGKE